MAQGDHYDSRDDVEKRERRVGHEDQEGTDERPCRQRDQPAEADE